MAIFEAFSAANITAWFTALGTVGTVVFGAYRYMSGRDRQIAIRTAFQNVINDLSDESRVKRDAAAILLRRFFDPATELGQKGTPYAKEALGVIAAILRSERTGEFQKLLADGLRLAPSLERADLQRTNLHNVYLARTKESTPNLSGADFFRADLSSASLRGADAVGAVFYQASLHNTILREADLRDANFYEADLLGVDFRQARLTGANFSCARNVPEALAAELDDDGTYTKTTVFNPPSHAGQGAAPEVFLSKPGMLSAEQSGLVTQIQSMLSNEGIKSVSFERSSYPEYGGAAQLRRVLSGCSGVVILGLGQLDVERGRWRIGTGEEEPVEKVSLPTSWNHFEAGMATMAGMPVLCIREKGVGDELFSFHEIDGNALEIDLARLDLNALREKIAAWAHPVREAAG